MSLLAEELTSRTPLDEVFSVGYGCWLEKN